MKKDYQVTICNSERKLKPVSTIIHYEQTTENDLSHSIIISKELRKQGLVKICQKRGWKSVKEVTALGFDRIMVRAYEPEKIKQQNKERYEQIQREKIASGEWKPSKAQKERLGL